MKNILFQVLCAAACCSAGLLLGACGSSEIDDQTDPVGEAGEGGASGGGQSGSGGASNGGASTGGVGPGSGGASTGGLSGGAGGGTAGMGGSISNDGGTEPVCSLPPDSGPCDAAIPRFYYDPNIGDCAEFTYGGCQGNANNFSTVEACRQACIGSADICALPVVPGPCRGALPRWFFNSSTG